MSPRVISAKTAGEAWVKTMRFVSKSGGLVYDGPDQLWEVLSIVIEVEDAQRVDETVQRFGDTTMIDWMRSNFMVQESVPEFGYSYAQRLRDYQGVNQIQWVIDRLRKNPDAKSATVALLQPGADEKHMPCICVLDFKLREGKLHLISFIRSQDIAKKLYADIIVLGEIQQQIASELGATCGTITLHVSSAHIYCRDLEFVHNVLGESTNSLKGHNDNAKLTLTYVSANQGKIEEVTQTLRRFNIEVLTKHMPFVEIQDSDVENIVRHKLEQVAKSIEGPLILDDTAIFLPAYAGFPGALAGYVLRSLGYEGFLRLLDDKDRIATMETAVAFYSPLLGTRVFRGKCTGRIANTPAGQTNTSFPFHRIFVPDGDNRTFAEMTFEEKSKHSARVKALNLLANWLSQTAVDSQL